MSSARYILSNWATVVFCCIVVQCLDRSWWSKEHFGGALCSNIVLVVQFSTKYGVGKMARCRTVSCPFIWDASVTDLKLTFCCGVYAEHVVIYYGFSPLYICLLYLWPLHDYDDLVFLFVVCLLLILSGWRTEEKVWYRHVGAQWKPWTNWLWGIGISRNFSSSMLSKTLLYRLYWSVHV